MDSLPKDVILEYNSNTLNEVRKVFGFDKQDAMKEAVDILDEWVQKQNHFTKKKFDRRYLETTIIVSKGSIERAKTRLDQACTLRTLMPHIFDIHDVKLYFETDLKDIKHAVFPKMTKNNERVYLLRNTGQKFESTLVNSFTKATLSLAEYIRRNDYAVSYYVIIDYSDVNLTELAKAFTFSALKEVIAMLLDCCGFRLNSMVLISSSKVIEIIVAIFKQLLSAKLGSRIHVLKDKDGLQNITDIDIFPKEYGGKEKSLDELHYQWLDVLTSEDHVEYLRDLNSARTDESLRQTDKFNEQYMGMPGSFRTISVD